MNEKIIVDLPMTPVGYTLDEEYTIESYGTLIIRGQIFNKDIPSGYRRYKVEFINER